MFKILWSIVLHTNLICAASYLGHFTKVEINLDNPLVRALDKSFVQEKIEICAEKCFLEKYFCNSFVLVFTANQVIRCVTSEYTDCYPHVRTSLLMIARANFKEPRKVDLQDEFSRNIKSSTEWIKDVKMGYPEGVQGKDWESFLLGCWESAVKGKPVTVVDIIEENGLLSATRDSGERDAKRRKLSGDEEISVERTVSRHSITEEIGVGLKSWPESSEFSDIIALAFLDIFSHNINGDYTTVFDPIKKSLFIHGEGNYLFIVSYGNGDYVIISDRLNAVRPPSIYVVGPYQKIQSVSAFKMFLGAMNLLGHQQTSRRPDEFPIGAYPGDNTGSALVVILFARAVLLPTSNSYYYTDIYNRSEPGILKCLIDMVPFVLSKVYDKKIRSKTTQSRLWKSSVENHFEKSMLDIITVPKSDSG